MSIKIYLSGLPSIYFVSLQLSFKFLPVYIERIMFLFSSMISINIIVHCCIILVDYLHAKVTDKHFTGGTQAVK